MWFFFLFCVQRLISGLVTELDCGISSCKLLDVHRSECSVGRSNQADGISIGTVSLKSGVLEWKCISASLFAPRASVLTNVVRCEEDDRVDSIVHRLASSKCLCVFLHGGPHSAVDTSFSAMMDSLLEAGMTVLAPNYLGVEIYGLLLYFLNFN